MQAEHVRKYLQLHLKSHAYTPHCDRAGRVSARGRCNPQYPASSDGRHAAVTRPWPSSVIALKRTRRSARVDTSATLALLV